MIVELIRQFYDLPRYFRILGQNGTEEFVQYSNAGLKPQMQGVDFGVDTGYRLPMFDIEITSQKKSPYSKLSQNEMALQFYGAGFFNPQMADQALACLEMMDFDRKDFIAQRIAQNGGMYQQIMMMQQQMAMMAQRLAQLEGAPAPQMGGAPAPGAPAPAGDAKMPQPETEGGSEGEAAHMKKSRQRVANATSPT
jgi:hypothetical protein